MGEESWAQCGRNSLGQFFTGHAQMYEFCKAAIRNYHKLTDLKQQNFFSFTVGEARIPKSRYWQVRGFSESFRGDSVP